MIDVSNVTYELMAALPTGATIPLHCSALQWEEQPGELAVRLQAQLPNVQTSLGGLLHETLALGVKLVLFCDWGEGKQEIWRGTNFTWRFVDSGAQTVEITAYDDLIFLQKSEDDRFYRAGLRASDVLVDIVSDWGIVMNGAGNLTVEMPKLVFRGMKVSQMIQTVLDEVYWRHGGVWLMRARQGIVEIVRPGTNRPVYVLGAKNAEEFSDEQDMHDLVTEVLIFGAQADTGDDETPVRPPVVARFRGHTEFGLLRAIVREDANEVDTMTMATFRALRVLSERGEPQRIRRLTAPDLPFLRRGDLVRLDAGTLSGRYAITGIQHDADRKRMQITIDTSGALDYRQAQVDPSVASTLATEPDDGSVSGAAQRSGPVAR